MDFLARLLKQEIEDKKKQQERKEKARRKKETRNIILKSARTRKRNEIKEVDNPFYLIEQRDESGLWYRIHDSYFHYCWASTQDRKHAEDLLVQCSIKMPTFETIKDKLYELASADTSGYIRRFIDEYELGEDEYRKIWARSDKGRSRSEPPKLYRYEYEQIKKYGVCDDWVPGQTSTIIEVDVKSRIKDKKLVERIKRLREERRHRKLMKVLRLICKAKKKQGRSNKSRR